jgi:dephospho-CoA kinase
MSTLANTFGQAVLCADGSLDRSAMRRLVFSDPSAKSKLEAILHPLIREESDARCRAASGAPYVMLVVPLMIESGAYRERVRRLLVVDCDESVQISRVMARSGLSANEVKGIMATQAKRLDRLAAADDVISNNGDTASLQLQVDQLHRYYLEISTFRL